MQREGVELRCRGRVELRCGRGRHPLGTPSSACVRTPGYTAGVLYRMQKVANRNVRTRSLTRPFRDARRVPSPRL